MSFDMDFIKQKIAALKKEIPSHVKLIAVSKTKPNEAISEAMEAGQLDFGENKVQELQQKFETLPKEINWHYIGHLQRNKVKYLVDFVHLIHGVDSLKLLKEINKRGEKANRKVPILLQMHIAEETTKFGLDQKELEEILNFDLDKDFPNIAFRGMMGMATNTENKTQVTKEFKGIRKTFEETAKQIDGFTELSIGMTNDYKIAIDEGATMIRIGSAIFGERNY